MPHVLSIDGNSLAHRAFHAMREDPDRADEFVLDGVVRMIATAWIEGPFDALVVGFDHPDNRRKLDDADYKAHREEKHPELIRQLELLRVGLEDCGLTVAMPDGAEADDVMAAVADRACERAWRCSILSSDRDLLALASDDVTVLQPRGSMANLAVMTPAAVLAEYGVRPDQYTDFAALRGDPSDGLKGVRGIGPKTAARLLRDYDDVPGIYANLVNLQPKTEAQLRAGRANVDRNLWLMAPIPNVEVDVDGALADGIDLEAIDAALLPRGLGRAAGQLRHAVERPPLPPMPPPPTSEHERATPVPTPTRSRPIDPAIEGEQASLF